MFEAAILFLKSTTGKIIAASFVAFLAGASVSMWAVSIYYKSDIAGLKLKAAETHDANTTAALRQFQETAADMAKAANEYGASQSQMRLSFDGIIRDLRNVSFKKPLPVDCKPDASRVQSMEAAVTTTNSFASFRQ